MNQNFLWKSNPFLRILIDAILGIGCYIMIERFSSILYVIILSLVVLILLWRTLSLANRFRWQKVQGIAIHVLIILLMYVNTHIFWGHKHDHHFSNFPQSDFILKLTKQKGQNEKWIHFEAEVVGALDSSNTLVSMIGKCLLHLPKESQQFNRGDLIFTTNSFLDVKPVSSPTNFDYQKYLATQNIRHEFYLKPSQFSFTGINHTNSVYQFAAFIQKWVEGFIDQNFLYPQHKEMLYALLLGNQQYLDLDLKKSFSETGTIHVLAISGLHMGIIYLFLQFLFQPMRRFKMGNYIQAFSTIFILWLFALITGFSPSVCRSAMMFTLFAIGSLLERRKSSINSWSATCFVLLIANPLFLVNVGFQFSFLAVGGILVWFIPLRQLVDTKSWFFSHILDLLTISFSAQMAILPLSVFYFSQFPVYFLLSNLIIVPCTTVVMYAALMSIVSSFIPIVASIFIYVCDAYLWFVINATQKFQGLPYGLIEDWFISIPIVLTMYFGIIGLIGFLCFKSKLTFRFVMYAGLISIICFGIEDQLRHKQQIICNLQIDKKVVPALIQGRECILFSEKTEDYALLNKSQKDWLKKNGIREMNQLQVPKAFLLTSGNQNILFSPYAEVSIDALMAYQPRSVYFKHKFWVLPSKIGHAKSNLKIPWGHEIDGFQNLYDLDSKKMFSTN